MKKNISIKKLPKTAILLIHCPDRKGLVAKITGFIFSHGGNIVDLKQHVDNEKQVFLMRVEWDLKNFSVPREELENTLNKLLPLKLKMQWKLYFSPAIPRVAIFVSRLSHCLYDILSRYSSGEWKIEIPLIVSNYQDLEAIAKKFRIPHYFSPVTSENKEIQEKKILEILKENKIEFIVLARYMQILSRKFISYYPNRIINIHHSFLPAFPGSKPYVKAYEKGVKIIGATAHYATAELDNGPIIEQDVVRVSHKDAIEDFIRKGRDLEKIVLARAIWYHLERRILVYGNRAIIFN